MIIEKDELQSENNEVIEQQRNQNTQGHQDKQPVDDLRVANNLVKGVMKSAKMRYFCLSFTNF